MAGRPVDRVLRELERFSRLGRADARAARRPPWRRILLATDGSPASRHALAWTREIALRMGTRVTVVVVASPRDHYEFFGPAAAQAWDAEVSRAKRALHSAAKRLEGAGVPVTATLRFGPPGREIAREAQRTRADLVVVGSHGRGNVSRLLLGSVADAVKDAAPADVLVARRPPPARHVLIALDDDPSSQGTVAAGMAVTEAFDADARILHVIPAPEFSEHDELVHLLEDQLRGLIEPRAQKRSWQIRLGPHAEHVLRAAKATHSTLVVIGTRGLTGAKRFLLGSVSTRVVHQASASVLIVKRTTRRPARKP